MKIETAKRIIKKELAQLDIQENSDAYIYIMHECTCAHDVLNTKELIQLVNDHAENFNFQQRGF